MLYLPERILVLLADLKTLRNRQVASGRDGKDSLLFYGDGCCT
jgi:hypothetical protein